MRTSCHCAVVLQLLEWLKFLESSRRLHVAYDISCHVEYLSAEGEHKCGFMWRMTNSRQSAVSRQWTLQHSWCIVIVQGVSQLDQLASLFFYAKWPVGFNDISQQFRLIKLWLMDACVNHSALWFEWKRQKYRVSPVEFWFKENELVSRM